jgi:hypothetical protein
MTQLWTADFAELVVIASGRKPANAQERPSRQRLTDSGKMRQMESG